MPSRVTCRARHAATAVRDGRLQLSTCRTIGHGTRRACLRRRGCRRLGPSPVTKWNLTLAGDDSPVEDRRRALLKARQSVRVPMPS
jgi:hypothetical protein